MAAASLPPSASTSTLAFTSPLPAFWGRASFLLFLYFFFVVFLLNYMAAIYVCSTRIAWQTLPATAKPRPAPPRLAPPQRLLAPHLRERYRKATKSAAAANVCLSFILSVLCTIYISRDIYLSMYICVCVFCYFANCLYFVFIIGQQQKSV